MYKLICNENKCMEKAVPYYFTEVEETAICGGCKSAIVPVVMTATEIAATFDYDFNTKPTYP